MPRFLNSPSFAAHPGRFSHAVLLGPQAKRLLISAQSGLKPDQTIDATLEGQMAQAFDNLLAVVEAAQMAQADLVRVTAYVAAPGGIEAFRQTRDAKWGKFAPAATYVEVASLSDPRFLVEIYAEAVREA